MAKESQYDIRPVDDVRHAVEGADVVVSSIPPSSDRPVRGEWLSPGSVFIPLDIVNAWHASALRGASRIVADNPAHFLSQVRNRRPDAFDESDCADRLQNIIAGQGTAAAPEGRTFVAVCGIASTDVVIGWEIYRRATAAGVGRPFRMC